MRQDDDDEPGPTRGLDTADLVAAIIGLVMAMVLLTLFRWEW